MKENSTISFSGQVIYVGIDVHKKSWKVTERHAGLVLRSYSMVPSPKQLFSRLTQNYPGATYKSVYEAGFCGFWINRELCALGIENMVINAADVPTSAREKANKNDIIDCRKLARELENRSLSALYVPSLEHQRLRDLVRRETQVVRDSVRVLHRLKSHLWLYGRDLTAAKPSGRLLRAMQEEAQKEGDMTLISLVDDFRYLRMHKLQIVRQEKTLLKELKRDELQRHLMTLPGIGFRTAILLQAEIWDMTRFFDKDSLSSYTGFAPHLVGSGEKESVRGGSKRKNGILHSALIESAWMAIGKDLELRQLYGRLRGCGKEPGLAISIVAHKLLMRVRRIWLDNRPYIFTEIP